MVSSAFNAVNSENKVPAVKIAANNPTTIDQLFVKNLFRFTSLFGTLSLIYFLFPKILPASAIPKHPKVIIKKES